MFIHRAYFSHHEHNLRLDYAHLTALPPQVWQRQDWRALSLAGNQLRDIDARMGELRELRALDLSANALSTLPDSFAQLQQLEVLLLSSNQFTQFPEVICQLPKLQFLQLKGNKIRRLPDSIGQLQHLHILDLSFNPLEALPDGLAQLTQLHNLLCTSNQFQVFPEVLLQLPQLQHPDNLDLHFRLRLPLPRLQVLFQLLRQAERQRIGLESRRVLFQLLFDRPLSAEDRTAALPLLLLNNNKALRRRLHAYLVQGGAALEECSRLGVLGKLQQLEPTWLAEQPSYTEALGEASHVVLGQQPTKTQLQQLPAHAIFVTEHQVQQHWAPLRRLPWLEQERDKVTALLLSGQPQSIALALSWMEGTTLVRDLANELLLAYTLLPVAAREVRGRMQRLFAHALPQFDRQHLPHPAFVFYKKEPPPSDPAQEHTRRSSKSERALTQRIMQYTHGVAYWSGTALAQLLFEQAGVGYDYLLQHLSANALQAWLLQFVEGETLCLSPLTALQALPNLEGAPWESIRRLDLRGCAFRRAPEVEQLQAFPQLEEVDLRHNPIRHLPRTALQQLARYRILLSK